MRKMKEAILARRMEKHLSKKDILYLYLNQVYFGQGAYGVASAAEIFFRKEVKELSFPEMAVLAGSLTAPSIYNIVVNPKRAKLRQKYVLKRMLETGRIDESRFEAAVNEALVINRQKKYKKVAPYFVETIRQLLVRELGEEMILDKGLKIYSSLDFEAQKKAQISLQGLRELDKRQGFRGAKRNVDIHNGEGLKEILTSERNRLIDENYETFQVFADGSTDKYGEFRFYEEKGQTLSNIPPYTKIGDIVEAGLPCSKTQNQSHKVPWCVCPEFQTPLPNHSKNQKSRETGNKVQKLLFHDLGHEAQKGFWNGHRDLLGMWWKVKSHFFHRGA